MLLFVAKLLFFNAEIVCLSASGGEQEYLSLKPQCLIISVNHGEYSANHEILIVSLMQNPF